jgi:hypothetical protein
MGTQGKPLTAKEKETIVILKKYFDRTREDLEEQAISGVQRVVRVKDIDFQRNEILVRNGKGAKDRITMLPGTLKMPLQEHLKTVKSLHERDLAEGWGRVVMPNALDRKYPNAPKDWRWQWVFPQENPMTTNDRWI